MSEIRTPVTPSVMEWCRKKAGYHEVDIAAKKIGRSVEEILAWENGNLLPTLAQLRKASEVYKRPLSVFFLPKPPSDFSTLQDFRTLPGGKSGEFSPQLALLTRDALRKQKWMSDFLRSEGLNELDFIGTVSLNNNYSDVADKIRTTIRLTSGEIINSKDKQSFFNLFKEKIEASRIFIFQDSIDLNEARGIAFCDSYAPFIFINSQDSITGRIFSLAHELVHIWLNESGISNMESSGNQTATHQNAVETFCNKAASEILVENTCFVNQINSLSSDKGIEEIIIRLSDSFNVSEEVIARKLLDNGFISSEKYNQLRNFYSLRWQKLIADKKKKTGKGGPSYYVTKLAKNGYAFTETVLSAYKNDVISGREISDLLGVKINNLVKLAEKIKK